MPEGPSIYYLRNRLNPFKNKVVKKAGGYGKMPTDWLVNKKLLDIRSWGKHLLLVFNNGTVRLHLGLFGSILINERKKVNRSFFLEFSSGEINGYVVKAFKINSPEDVYDWRTDIMSPDFDKAYVKKLLLKYPERSIDDLLTDQNIFSGSGNIIRNEALYHAGIHPFSITGKIPAAGISKLINEVLNYSEGFYQTLKKGEKLKDFGVYKQKYTPRGSEVTTSVLKKSGRKIYFSEHEQRLYE